MKYEGINPLELLKPGEPYFFLRGQDVHAIPLIRAYATMISTNGVTQHQRSLDNLIESFATWQKENPGKVKEPD